MSKTIYKYKLNILEPTVITGRIDKFISVQYQNTTKSIVAWAIVDDKLDNKDYVVWSFGTGHKLPKFLTADDFIGTVQLYSGETILHFFATEIKSESGRENVKEWNEEFELGM